MGLLLVIPLSYGPFKPNKITYTTEREVVGVASGEYEWFSIKLERATLDSHEGARVGLPLGERNGGTKGNEGGD